MVGVNEVRDPAMSLETVVLHEFEPGYGIHDRITGFFHGNHLVDDLDTFFLANHQVFRTGKRSVEIYRDTFNGRIPLDITDGLFHGISIVFVDHHIDAQMLVPAFGNIFFQTGKSAFAPHHLVVFAVPVQAHPDTVGMATGKRKLVVIVTEKKPTSLAKSITSLIR